MYKDHIKSFSKDIHYVPNLSRCWAGIAGHGSFNPDKVSGESGVNARVTKIRTVLSIRGDANLNSIDKDWATKFL